MSGRKIYEGKQGDVLVQLYGSEAIDPEFYIDGVHGILNTGSSVKLNLYTLAVDSTADVQRREVACRLAMSTPQFVRLVDMLNAYVQQLRQQAVQAQQVEGAQSAVANAASDGRGPDGGPRPA